MNAVKTPTPLIGLSAIAFVGVVGAFMRLVGDVVTRSDVYAAIILLAAALTVAYGAFLLVRRPLHERSGWERAARHGLVTVSAIVVVCSVVFPFYPTKDPERITSDNWQKLCDENPDVPSKLKLLDDCVEARGVVKFVVINFPDGDQNICLVPDPGYGNLLNEVNERDYYGCLMVEVEPLDWLSHKVAIPKKGDHVRVVGPWVRDEGWFDNGPFVSDRWHEIHPAASIELIRAASAS